MFIVSGPGKMHFSFVLFAWDVAAALSVTLLAHLIVSQWGNKRKELILMYSKPSGA